MKTRSFIISLAFFTAASAAAWEVEGMSNVGAAYVMNFPIGPATDDYDPSFLGGGFKFGHTYEHFGGELWIDLIFDRDGELSLLNAKAGALLLAAPKRRFSPYFNGGILVQVNDYGSGLDLGLYAGLGSRWMISEHWALVINPNLTLGLISQESYHVEVPVGFEFHHEPPDWMNPANWFDW
jgi:hypothetical protein